MKNTFLRKDLSDSIDGLTSDYKDEIQKLKWEYGDAAVEKSNGSITEWLENILDQLKEELSMAVNSIGDEVDYAIDEIRKEIMEEEGIEEEV